MELGYTYLKHNSSDGLSLRYVAAKQKFGFCSCVVSNTPQLMFHNLVNTLHIPLTVPSYFSQGQCLFPHEPLDCCLRMLIIWNRQPRAQVAQHPLLLWVQSSCSCVILSISILLVCLFKFNSVVQSIYSFSGFSTTQHLLISALSQSSELLTSESQRPVMLSLGRNIQYQSLSPGFETEDFREPVKSWTWLSQS